jgi:hypothetical protein
VLLATIDDPAREGMAPMNDDRTGPAPSDRERDAAPSRSAPMAGKVTRVQDEVLTAAPAHRSPGTDGHAGGSTQRAGDWRMDAGLMAAMGLAFDDSDSPQDQCAIPSSAPQARPDALVGSQAVARAGRAASAPQSSSSHVGTARSSGSDPMWGQVVGEASTSVGKLARVSAPKGVRLRTGAAANQADLGILPFDELVQVERRTAHGWCWVIPTGALAGKVGFCEERFLSIDPPEPTAHLYRVEPGDQLLEIAQRYYGKHFRDDHDARLYVQALVEANKGRKGIYVTDVELGRKDTLPRGESEEHTLRVFRGAKVREGHSLWVPSEAFIAQLRASGAVTSGSTELSKAWSGAKEAVGAAVDVATYGAAFTVGLLEGAWNAIADLFQGAADMIELVAKTVYQLVTGNLGAIKATLIGWVDQLKAAWAGRDKIADDFMRQWESDDAWTRGNFQGEVLGWVMMTALLILATAGSSSLAVATGKWASVLRALRTVDALGDITTYVGQAARLPGKATAVLRRKLDKGASEAAELADEVLEAEGDAARTASHAEEKGNSSHERQPSVASGVEEPPEPVLRGGHLSARQVELDKRLEHAAEGMIEIGKREVTATDLAALTKSRGVEHAVVILQDGKRQLVRLGSYKGGTLPANVKRLLMHSHPDDFGSGMAKFISEADVEAIVTLGQKYSYMVTIDGTVYKFTASTIPMSVGEVVRKFHPILGWVGK